VLGVALCAMTGDYVKHSADVSLLIVVIGETAVDEAVCNV